MDLRNLYRRYRRKLKDRSLQISKGEIQCTINLKLKTIKADPELIPNFHTNNNNKAEVELAL